MKIDNGIIMLEVSSNVPGMFIHPTVIWDDDNMILVDAGYSGQYDAIKMHVLMKEFILKENFYLLDFLYLNFYNFFL
jgi:hypothetical protein